MASFYVAGKFENRAPVRRLQRQLLALGHTISYDWTLQAPTDDTKIQHHQAGLDFKGVLEAQVLVLLFMYGYEPLNSSVNRYVELGVGLGAGKVVCIIGTPDRACIFYGLLHVHKYGSTRQFMTALRAGEVI